LYYYNFIILNQILAPIEKNKVLSLEELKEMAAAEDLAAEKMRKAAAKAEEMRKAAAEAEEMRKAAAEAEEMRKAAAAVAAAEVEAAEASAASEAEATAASAEAAAGTGFWAAAAAEADAAAEASAAFLQSGAERALEIMGGGPENRERIERGEQLKSVINQEVSELHGEIISGDIYEQKREEKTRGTECKGCKTQRWLTSNLGTCRVCGDYYCAPDLIKASCPENKDLKVVPLNEGVESRICPPCYTRFTEPGKNHKLDNMKAIMVRPIVSEERMTKLRVKPSFEKSWVEGGPVAEGDYVTICSSKEQRNYVGSLVSSALGTVWIALDAGPGSRPKMFYHVKTKNNTEGWILGDNIHLLPSP